MALLGFLMEEPADTGQKSFYVLFFQKLQSLFAALLVAHIRLNLLKILCT